MNYDIQLAPESKFTSGRTRSIDTIVLHQYNTPEDAGTYEETIQWLLTTAEVSIHYVVSGNQFTLMVDEEDTAWHAMEANARSIGIEFDPNNMDYDFAARVVAWIADRRNISPDRILSHNQAMKAFTKCPQTIDWQRIRDDAINILQGDDMVDETIANVYYRFYLGTLVTDWARENVIVKMTPNQLQQHLLNSDAYQEILRRSEQGDIDPLDHAPQGIRRSYKQPEITQLEEGLYRV